MALFGFGKKKEKTAPTSVPETPEALFQKGMDAYNTKDFKTALALFEKAAQQNYAAAQFFCGLMYNKGEGTTVDKAKGFILCKKAAEQGIDQAQFTCGLMYDYGEGTAVDKAKAVMWYEKAAAQGHEKSKSMLATLKVKDTQTTPAAKPVPASTPKPGDDLTPEEQYTKGMELFKAGDYDGAYDMLRRVCRAIGAKKDDYPSGQAAMGWMYENGRGTEQKDSMAHRHYKIAARNGNKDGMAGMVRLTIKMEEPGVSDCQTALDYIKQLGTDEAKSLLSTAEQKLTEAQKRETAETERKQYEEELKQIFGEGVAAYKVKDYEKALSLFEKTAEQGLVTAQFNCGIMYNNGEGTAKDEAKALMWFERAAGQGHVDAQFICGEMYNDGRGTPENKATALMWYEKAAEQGYERAYYWCGEACFFSDTALNYPEKALAWYEKAAKVGDTKAEKRISELQQIIACIKRVVAGSTKTDKKLANFLSLDKQERQEFMDNELPELSTEQRVVLAHFLALGVLAGVENMKKEEDKLAMRTMAKLNRQEMLDTIRRGW